MTQEEMMIKYLKKHKTITTLEAVKKLFILDPQGVIRRLREKYNISDKWITKRNIYGQSKSFKKYRLEGER